VNLILFEAAETARPLPRADARAQHLLTVLRRKEGDRFDAGLVNGPRGKGTVVAIGTDELRLAFEWGPATPPLDPVVLIIGLPRPQTARKILQEATALGVSAMHFVRTDRGEANYAQSTLWQSGEWQRHLRAGAGQAFDPRLPEVSHGRTLAEAVAAAGAGARLALDNYEGAEALGTISVAAPVTLAIGSERGWTDAERTLLRRQAFALAHLGPRVLRTETACVASVAIVKARLGWL
jgi:16S rRNA (uracil1498-N3)-methyltransferase